MKIEKTLASGKKFLIGWVFAFVVLGLSITYLSIGSPSGTLLSNFNASDRPSGTVTYKDQSIPVTNGQFTLEGISGNIDSQGNYTWNGSTGNILNTPGVTGFQIAGQAPVVVSPTTKPSGNVTYNGQVVAVTNGVFMLNGKSGTIDSQGNYNYDGQTGNILSLAGVTSYQFQWQAAVTISSGTDLKTWVNNLPANQGRGNMNYGRRASWQEFSPNVSHVIMTAWLKANPSLTPRQIFTNMQANGITLLTVKVAHEEATNNNGGDTLYNFNMGRFGSPSAWVVASEVVTTKSLYDAGLIQVPFGTGPGWRGSPNGVFNGQNVYLAAAAGWLNKWVMYADKYGIPPVTGKTDEEVSYSQKDLDEAKKYRLTGYWGPSESGMMDVEFRKAGLVTGDGLNTRENFPGGWWSNDRPTGPNIADPAVYKYVPTGWSGSGTTSTGTTTGVTTGSLNINTKAIIDNWITAKIVSRKSNLSAGEYQNFLTLLITKMNTLKSETTTVNKINILNYIIARLTVLQQAR